jgi:uncharacterized protein involved in exopolysaccharide biosynthesis
VTSELTRLENEVRLTFNIYNGLRAQMDQAEITLKKETPVFNVLEPPQYLPRPTEPRFKWIFPVFTAVGILVSSIYLLILFLIRNRQSLISRV